ncbi:MAG: prepilin-type N-terminal cleavage/methylation domain-containing protein [Tissierellales bacterium]|nr:prepilin-type N-terminal cleavage/methylation domain-containing protein [Tissierellales bacterium]MBN2826882.1 prepilin-type N-terminal cleavage/methylation domain-containing protein [Tissierellales bacterium]
MKNIRGFTLIEIILSMALLFAFIIPASNMLMVCCKTYMSAEAQLSSAVELQAILEVIKSEGDLSHLINDGESHNWPEHPEITYQVLPLHKYKVAGQEILYQIVLQKSLPMGTIYKMTGTIINLQKGILHHGETTEE